MEALDVSLFLSGLLIICCVLCSKLSSRFNMPCLLIFLAVGMGARVLYLHSNSEAMEEILKNSLSGGGMIPWPFANYIGSVALIYILFSGGFDTSLKSIKPVWKVGGILSSVGVLVTALLLAVFAFFLFNYGLKKEIPFIWCLLLGSIISSTDAAAVFSILRSRSVSLKGNLQAVLEFESGSNDPMAAFLTIAIVNIIESGNAISFTLIPYVLGWFALKMAVGILIGYGVGKFGIWIYNRLALEYDGLYYVMVLGVVLVSYACSQCLWGNGYMSVYVTGIVMGNSRFVFKNSIGRFSGGVSWLMQVVLFTMLGFQANYKLVLKFGIGGLILGGFLMFVARPVACYLCTLGNKLLSWKERTLIGWVGLRGGAPIMLATFPMMLDVKDSLQFGEISISVNSMIFHVIFVMVILSVVIQGMTIMPLAKFFNLNAPLDTIPTSPLSFDMTAEHSCAVNSNKCKDASDGEISFDGVFTRNFVITEQTGMTGKKLAELGLPRGAFVLTILRGSRYIVPKGDSVLHKGDSLTILGNTDMFKDIDSKISGAEV